MPNYALFFSRIKIFISKLFSRRYLWSLPKNQSIVILDETGSKFLIPCLGDSDYFILKKRSVIYLKYLLAAILFDKKIRDLNYWYCTRMIERLNPVLIITYISNCPLYMRLDKAFKKGYFLTIQNGTHRINPPTDLPKYLEHLYFENIPYFSNFVCISKFDVDYFSKMDIEVENFYPTGSISSSEHVAGFLKKSNKYDLCIVANTTNSRPENIKLWDYIFKYIENHNVSVCMALKRNILDNSFNTHIKGLEKFFSSSNVTIIENNKYSSHNASDVSEVTIGAYSTLLRQTFSRGNKIYPINFSHSSISPPYDLLGYPLDPTYEEFQSHLDYLLSVDQQAYSDRYRELMAYLDIFSLKNPPHKKLENIIKELVSSAKPFISK
jgi:hypothetical protein